MWYENHKYLKASGLSETVYFFIIFSIFSIQKKSDFFLSLQQIVSLNWLQLQIGMPNKVLSFVQQLYLPLKNCNLNYTFMNCDINKYQI